MGFWDTIGKVASALMEEGARKQQEVQKRAGQQMKAYERKISNVQSSPNMANPEYERKVKEAKAKLEQVQKNMYGTTTIPSDAPRNTEVGHATLKEIASPLLYINRPGVYILKVNGSIMKVGSAKIGVQKRMQQYYGLNQHCGLSHISEYTRDLVQVTFQHCPIDKCTELESKLFDKYGGVASMPWSERRPHSNEDTYRLRI